jgi:putative ABC transport system ATP-binding protein
VPYLNVADNIRLPALAHKSGIDGSRVSDLTSSLGLEERLRHTPAELSAGEKQRVALARALLFRPGILLADEITGNLDPHNTEIVLGSLENYTRSGGAVMLVTHDATAASHADRVLSLGSQATVADST